MLRGRALRDAFILRLLAVERGMRGVLLVALAYGIYKFDGARDALQQVFDTYLPLLRPRRQARHRPPGRRTGQADRERARGPALDAALVAFGVLAYGALQLREATGLWLMRRWGEYVAVVGTSAFIPLEVYEIVEKVTWLRIAALVVNVVAVVYIVWTKRLFGFRGGHAAFEAERHGESLLEVESAAAV